MDPPSFFPPIKFEIERSIVPPFVYDGVPNTTEILKFRHDDFNFQLNYKKDLAKYDVKFGFLSTHFIKRATYEVVVINKFKRQI